MNGFHGEHDPGHGRIEGGCQPCTGTAADQGPFLQVGIVQGIAHTLACHGPDLHRRPFPSHGEPGPDAQGCIHQFHQDDPGPVGTFFQPQHNAPHLGNAASSGNGSPAYQQGNDQGNQDQGGHPDQGIGRRYILEKMHHPGPVLRHKAQTEPQQDDAQPGRYPHQDPLKSQFQLQVGNVQHPLQGFLSFCLIHLSGC